jgi:hypothetical protein
LTYNGEQTRTGANVLKTLVILTIVWVAYWAATGGLDRIVIPDAASSGASVAHAL